ncbi:uncharacterized protein BDR25DRAFT_343510 [Lindgomyces ingoldianus]|uniref:Uncharacterized protein n=1 Tax=Lindgomyces ingoldianus TaxID=673940 RepID=A0ACB6QTD9_9PLEO|nr:uncharacterized protein BDR25DRAFT_343510 [Lindgomyces ingoldianus]KAF2469838.1 hypothetical protein BDR25DRAFT_343510 [Lindgomyces ingoldianus]
MVCRWRKRVQFTEPTDMIGAALHLHWIFSSRRKAPLPSPERSIILVVMIHSGILLATHWEFIQSGIYINLDRRLRGVNDTPGQNLLTRQLLEVILFGRTAKTEVSDDLSDASMGADTSELLAVYDLFATCKGLFHPALPGTAQYSVHPPALHLPPQRS